MELTQEISAMRNKVHQLKGQRELLIRQMNEAEELREKHSGMLEVALQARVLIQVVAERTQKRLEWHISNLVTTALASVFPDPYDFSLRFVQRRNKTEADLIFSKNGNESDDLLNTAGGGVVDVAGFALRIALWAIRKNRAVIVMDEPMRFLSADLQQKASDMLKEISSKLRVQIIMISHLQGLIASADRVIEVKSGTVQ